MMLLPRISNEVFEDSETARSVELKPFDLYLDAQYGYFFNNRFSDATYDPITYQNEQAHSSVFRRHLDQVLDICKQHFTMEANLVEIGCGKGTFLKILGQNGFLNLSGFDRAYQGQDLRIVKEYLSDRFAPLLADGVILRHVLEHIPNPVSFLESVERVNGRPLKFVIEVPSMDWNVRSKAYWDFGYEHVNYFTIASFEKIFRQSEIFELFGGQYLLVVAESSSLISKSQSLSMPSDVFESILQSSISKSPLTQYARSNKRYWVWGAGGKGVLLMFHLSKTKFGKLNMPIAIVDINPGKQNRFTVSTAVQIVPPSIFFEKACADDVVFITNPMYEQEITNFVRENCDLRLNFSSV
jgi:hypothetical protein